MIFKTLSKGFLKHWNVLTINSIKMINSKKQLMKNVRIWIKILKKLIISYFNRQISKEKIQKIKSMQTILRWINQFNLQKKKLRNSNYT